MPRQKQAGGGGAVSIPAEVGRYRLALLDAAQVAETIAADMTAEGQDSEFVERCADLARQMREFAGHTPGQDTLGGGQSGAGNTGTALTRFLRKGWPR